MRSEFIEYAAGVSGWAVTKDGCRFAEMLPSLEVARELALDAGPGHYLLADPEGDLVAELRVTEGFEARGWTLLLEPEDVQEQTFTERCRGQSALAG